MNLDASSPVLGYQSGFGNEFSSEALPGDLAGLGQGVPLVLHAAGVEHEGERVFRHFCGWHMGAGEELGFAVFGGEGEGACVQVADRGGRKLAGAAGELGGSAAMAESDARALLDLDLGKGR